MKKKRMKKNVIGNAIIILASMVIPSGLVLVESIDKSPPKSLVKQERPYSVDSENADVDEEPQEAIEERTETETVLDNQDGMYTKKIYQEPVYSENEETGELEAIDTQLEKVEQEVVPKNIDLQVHFLNKMENGYYQVVGEGIESIHFSFKGASGDSKENKSGNKDDENSEKEEEKLEVKPQ